MWRFILFVVLGLLIGSRARSERWAVAWSLLFGLLYGGIEVLVAVTTSGWPSAGRVFLLLGLGVVLAAPVYAIAELYRRARGRVRGWLRRWGRG